MVPIFKENIDPASIGKFGDRRNLFAHGCISFEESEIHISMPERDGMFKTDINTETGIKIYSFEKMDEYISEMAMLITVLQLVRGKWMTEIHSKHISTSQPSSQTPSP